MIDYLNSMFFWAYGSYQTKLLIALIRRFDGIVALRPRILSNPVVVNLNEQPTVVMLSPMGHVTFNRVTHNGLVIVTGLNVTVGIEGTLEDPPSKIKQFAIYAYKGNANIGPRWTCLYTG